MAKVKDEHIFKSKDVNIHDSGEIKEMNKIINYNQSIMSIATCFYKKRCELKLNQKEFADMLGISQAMLSKIETGRINPTIKNLQDFSWKIGNNSDFFIEILNTIIMDLNKIKILDKDLENLPVNI